MKIEFLYSEVANLFGEIGQIDFIKKIFSNADFYHTQLNEKPKCLTEDIDLVYLGPMEESTQEYIIQKLKPYKNEIKSKIEDNKTFLFIGNAMEIFFEYIEKDNGEKIEALGLFPFYAKRQMMNRINDLFLGKYKENIDIVGFKSQFTYAHKIKDSKKVPYLFSKIRGFGMDRESNFEGIHYKNFFGSYLIGPLLIMNPEFTLDFISTFSDVKTLPFIEDLKFAHNRRIEEFKDKDTII